MADDTSRIAEIAESLMGEAVRSVFTNDVLEDLRVVIGFTEEFHRYLEHGIPGLRSKIEELRRRIDLKALADMDEQEQIYVSQSTFAGIESFCNLQNAYAVLVGALPSRLDIGVASVPSLRELFSRVYRDFQREADPMLKFRHLLDLFKIQIVFAGVVYG